MDAYLDAMRHYAVFKGRTSRSGFWQFYAVYLGVLIIALLLDTAFGTTGKNGGAILAFVHLTHIIPQIAISVRRLHDTDRTGWWYLIAFTIIGLPVFIVLACLRGTSGANRFGDVPLAPSEPMAVTATPAITAGASAITTVTPTSVIHRDPIAEIERLGQLRSAGHLSQAEFDAMKTRILTQAHGA